MSQATLAEALETSASAIGHYEAGRAFPSQGVSVRLERLIGGAFEIPRVIALRADGMPAQKRSTLPDASPLRESLAVRLERIAEHGPSSDSDLDRLLMEAACVAAAKRMRAGQPHLRRLGKAFHDVLSKMLNDKAPAPTGRTDGQPVVTE